MVTAPSPYRVSWQWLKQLSQIASGPRRPPWSASNASAGIMGGTSLNAASTAARGSSTASARQARRSGGSAPPAAIHPTGWLRKSSRARSDLPLLRGPARHRTLRQPRRCLRGAGARKSDQAVKVISFLGNDNAEHAITMQNASDYSARFIMGHFSMVRIDRASLFVAVILLLALLPPINNRWWIITPPINLVSIYVLYHVTKKAYTYYKLLRDQVGMVIAEEIGWERRNESAPDQSATKQIETPRRVSESLQRMSCFAPNPPKRPTENS